MNSHLEILKGRRIQNAIRCHDYLQLFFEQGVTLNIYNAYSFIGFEEDKLTSLIGSVIQEISKSAEEVVLCFDCDKEIHVDLHDEAYNGPEAMQLNAPGKPIVVWN